MSATPIADMVRILLERDVSRDEIVTIVALAEQHADTANRHASSRDVKDKAAARAKKYRENKKSSVTLPSRDEAKPPLTVLPASRDSEDTKKEKKVRARKHPLPPEFQPDDGHFAAALKLGRPRQYVFEKTEDMRIWAGSSGALKVDWGLTLHGFMRRDASKYSNNGKQNGQDKSVLAAFDRLEQSLAGGDDNALRQDDLLSLPSR